MLKKLSIVLIFCLVYTTLSCVVIPAANARETLNKFDWLLVIAATGLSRDDLFYAVKSGRYPAIAKIYSESFFFDNCHTSLVASPETALAELLTGEAGWHAIGARRWLDEVRVPHANFIEDRTTFVLERNIRTIFDYREGNSLSLECPISQGATVKKWADFTVLPRLIHKPGSSVEKQIFDEFKWIADRKLPKTTVMLLNDSAIATGKKPYDRRVVLSRLDRLIGLVYLYLRDSGRWEEGMIVLAGLPGVKAGTNRVRLKQYLQRKIGLDIRIYDDGNETPITSALAKNRCLVMPNGRSLFFYFSMLSTDTLRQKAARREAESLYVVPGIPMENLVEALRQQLDVELIVHPSGPRKLTIYGRHGKGTIVRYSEGLRYQTTGEIDPLGINDDRILRTTVNGAIHKRNIYLNILKELDKPGSVPLLDDFFQWEQAPPLLVILRKNCFLDGAKIPGSSGGMSRDEILAPVLIHGPGIKHARIRISELRDVIPTILKALNIPHKLPGKTFEILAK